MARENDTTIDRHVHITSHISNQMGSYVLISFLLFVVCGISSAGETQLFDSQQTLPLSCPAPGPTLNYQPVIGIVSHPSDGASGRLSNATNISYIVASYVKFAEMAGARVIHLIYTEPPEILNQKLNLVNSIIFTGGWAKDGLYFDVINEFSRCDHNETQLWHKIESILPSIRGTGYKK